jgi:hypothetical protein
VGLVTDEQRPEEAEMLFHGTRGEQGEKGDTGARGLTSRTVRAIVSLFLVAAVIGAGALLLGANAKNEAASAVAANNAKWCTVLDLLTQHPVPYPSDPAKNPSRLQAYVLYSDFHQLRRQLGCG